MQTKFYNLQCYVYVQSRYRYIIYFKEHTTIGHTRFITSSVPLQTYNELYCCIFVMITCVCLDDYIELNRGCSSEASFCEDTVYQPAVCTSDPVLNFDVGGCRLKKIATQVCKFK